MNEITQLYKYYKFWSNDSKLISGLYVLDSYTKTNERLMLEMSLRDRTPNEALRKTSGSTDVVTIMAMLKWNWIRHVVRLCDLRWDGLCHGSGQT